MKEVVGEQCSPGRRWAAVRSNAGGLTILSYVAVYVCHVYCMCVRVVPSNETFYSGVCWASAVALALAR